MLLKRMNVLMQTAGEQPSGGGGVSEPGSPSGEADPNLPGADDALPADPGGEGDPAAPQERRGREPVDNPIPYSRVRQMLASTAQEAEQRAYQRLRGEVGPIIEQLRQANDPAAAEERVSNRILEALGKKPAPKPEEPLTRAELQRTLAQQKQEFDSRLAEAERERATISLANQAVEQMSGLKSEFPEVFKAVPKLEERIRRLWGTTEAAEAGLSVTDIGRELIEDMMGLQGKLSAPQETTEQRPAPKAVVAPLRPGGAKPTPKPGKLDTDEKVRNAALTLLAQRGVK